MKTIVITTILGSELKSRTSARDFAKYLQNMDIQAQEFLKVVKVTADAPRKTASLENARFLNPGTFQQLSEYLTTL